MRRSHNDRIETISNLTANVRRPGAVLLFKVKPPKLHINIFESGR